MDKYFNNHSLTDAEAIAIINRFEKFIKEMSKVHGKYSEDCAQEIRIQIYKSLTYNRKNKKI